MTKLSNRCFLLTIALVLLAADAAWACPTCKEAVAGDPSSQNVVRGYFWSILFMLSMPMLISSFFGFYIYRTMRKLRKQQAAQALAQQSPIVSANDVTPPPSPETAVAASKPRELSEANA